MVFYSAYPEPHASIRGHLRSSGAPRSNSVPLQIGSGHRAAGGTYKNKRRLYPSRPVVVSSLDPYQHDPPASKNLRRRS